MHFFEKIEKTTQEKNTYIVLGLDPRDVPADKLAEWGKGLIDQTEEHVCAIKPNLAYYNGNPEQNGSTDYFKAQQALIEIIDYAKEKGLPTILDSKYGDIGSTSGEYAQIAWNVFNADCVTLHSYMGYDTVKPFLENFPEKGVIIMARTSNPSSEEFQNDNVKGLKTYQQVVKKSQKWPASNQIGYVVGATQPESLKNIRVVAPNSWILAPGLGPQGGDVELTATYANNRVLFPISRGITTNKDMAPAEAAKSFKEQVNQYLRNQKPLPTKKETIINSLIEHDLIKFSEEGFTLKSGAISPIYIDLRSIQSYPDLANLITSAYTDIIQDAGLEYDHVAAVPYGALNQGYLVGSYLDTSVLTPRKEVKEHGLGGDLVGQFQDNQKVLIIEDLATSGKSTLETAEKLRANNLQVTDTIVLLDREAGGRKNLSEQGIKLHHYITMEDIIEAIENNGETSKVLIEKVKSFYQEHKI